MIVRRPQYARREANPKAARVRSDAKRGSAVKRGYNYAWQQHREVFLANHPFCIACVGLPSPAVVIDHIIPVAQKDGEEVGQADPLFWPSWNHQPVCRMHHRIKTDMHDQTLRDNRHRILSTLRLESSDEDDDVLRQQLLEFTAIWPAWLNLMTGVVSQGKPV